MKLEFLGCTQSKINQFNSRNIYTVEDLVKNLPRCYMDFRNPKLVKEIANDDTTSMILTIVDKKVYINKNMVILFCIDTSGAAINVLYFNQVYLYQTFDLNCQYIFCGKISEREHEGTKSFSMINPSLYSKDIDSLKKMIPVYSKINNMSELYYNEKIVNAISVIDKEDYIEPSVQNKFNLISEYEAILHIHLPNIPEDVQKAKDRILFDDLFYYNYIISKQSKTSNNSSEFCFSHYKKTKEFLNILPYSLTDGQRETLIDIAKTTRKKERVNAVIMGDVGCGKTVIAELAMLMAFDEGYQSVLLAPTVVLASQHYLEISSMLTPLGISSALLTSQTSKKEKKSILVALKNGEIDMLIGTHSVLNPEIEYKKLALTIIDEEHKFGVRQRDKFRARAANGVHTISMSATPIPRTLALSVYGTNIKTYTIKSLPKGRKPIKTVYKKNDESAFRGIKTQLDKGLQAYIVCPMIESGGTTKTQDISCSEDMFEKAKKAFIQYGFKVAHINAKMKQKEIEDIIHDFSNKHYDVLVSTTIIEVGVNIPNATAIYIANAERFGLAQLHQLRGRVGRGNDRGYCLLGSSLKTETAKEKIKTMCETNDGFKIAQKDLEMRGCGDFIGTVQSGDNKYISLMISNEKLNNEIFKEIESIVSDVKRAEWYDTKMQKQFAREYDIEKAEN